MTAQVEPDRELYLAIRQEIWEDVFDEPIGKLLIDNKRLKLLVFKDQEEEIVQWVS